MTERIETVAARIEALSPETPADRIAREYVDRVPYEVVTEVARQGLAELVRSARAERLEREEREARRNSPEAQAEREWQRDRRAWKRSQQQEREQLLRNDPAEYKARYTLAGVIDRFRSEVRDELMVDLSATFAMPDGRVVAWGSATIADHQVAASAALEAVDRDLFALARHEEAAAFIQSRGATCLGDLVEAAA